MRKLIVASMAAGLALAAAAMPSKSELKKVVWPTKKQLATNTGVALVVMAISAVVLWGFDELASLAVNTIFKFAGVG